MKEYTIKQVIEMSGMSNAWIRRAISQGKLKTEKREYGEKGQFKHIITEEAWQEFRMQSGTKRDDGRSRFVLYANSEELQQLLDSGFIVEKQKQYNKKAEAE